MRIKSFILLSALLLLPRLAAAQTGCGVPAASDDHWPVGTPESVGLESATLCPVVTWLGAWKDANIHAIVVVRHGTLVFEHYFAGTDERLGQATGTVAFGPETKQISRHGPIHTNGFARAILRRKVV